MQNADNLESLSAEVGMSKLQVSLLTQPFSGKHDTD
jgi:hypothetical protein